MCIHHTVFYFKIVVFDSDIAMESRGNSPCQVHGIKRFIQKAKRPILDSEVASDAISMRRNKDYR